MSLSGQNSMTKTALLIFGPVPIFATIIMLARLLIGSWALLLILPCWAWGWWAQGYAIKRGWS